MAEVEVYFDYSSPYAYLGVSQVERVAAEAGASVLFKPFLLGALFKAIGTPIVPLAVMSESKRRYNRLELDRWADHWGVPFKFTSHFPLRTVAALRLTLCTPAAERPALIHRIMRACWVEDRDINDPAVLSALVAELHQDPANLLASGQPEAKKRLFAATEEAINIQCPGAPCFRVGPHLYWGQDRLHFVKLALEGRAPGPSIVDPGL